MNNKLLTIQYDHYHRDSLCELRRVHMDKSSNKVDYWCQASIQSNNLLVLCQHVKLWAAIENTKY